MACVMARIWSSLNVPIGGGTAMPGGPETDALFGVRGIGMNCVVLLQQRINVDKKICRRRFPGQWADRHGKDLAR